MKVSQDGSKKDDRGWMAQKSPCLAQNRAKLRSKMFDILMTPSEFAYLRAACAALPLASERWSSFRNLLNAHSTATLTS